ncbi:MAG TPA: DUF2853 family protein [Flavobacteriaceae bacterium]|nr:DUF2853 family protein [Flavobacteriaceae bacterium]
MSKFDDAVEKYVAASKKLNLGLTEEYLRAVARGLGPSIYNADAELVSSSDPEELKTVKNNFLIKKLELADGPELDKAIDEVIEKLGSSNPNKYRALVYGLLAKKFNKESVYLK